MTRKAREARPKGSAEKPLNERQRKFAKLYAASGNATQSAIGAGYSSNSAGTNADKLLKNTKLREYLTQLSHSAQSSRIATREERQQFWTSTMRGEVCKGEAPRFADCLKASELLGKAQADFVDRREVTGKGGAPIQQERALTLEGKSIEELTALYKAWTR